jgi:4-hydroxybenzoate polyprenyltransferase
VASGRISVKQALAFVVGCSLVSLGILLTLGLHAIVLGLCSLVLVAAYPFMKRITWWPQAWLGLTFNWGVLMGFAAAIGPAMAAAAGADMGLATLSADHSGPVDRSLHDLYVVMPGPQFYITAVLLYLSGVFWTLGYDTIYALQDVEDDAMVGVKSSARRLGANVRGGVGAFYAVSVVLAGLAGAAAGLGPLFWVGLALFAAHLARQTVRVRRDDGVRALTLFKSNREAGLILLSATGLGAIGWPI